jgi:hypothetical protein
VNYLHYDLDLAADDVVENTLDRQANVRLLDASNFARYRRADTDAVLARIVGRLPPEGQIIPVIPVSPLALDTPDVTDVLPSPAPPGMTLRPKRCPLDGAGSTWLIMLPASFDSVALD